jgi:hypothetical protein
MEYAIASSIGLCNAGLSWLCPGRRGVGESVGARVSLGHEVAIYACVCNLLAFLLLLCLLFNAFTIIQTRSREESGTLSR